MTCLAQPAGGSLDAIILVGGKGTRLASVVKDVPKPLAAIEGRPFLDHLLALVAQAASVRSITLAAGHLGAEVERYVAGLELAVPIKVIMESEPLGTAGAVKNALAWTAGDRLLLLNGDAISDWPIDALVAFHDLEGVPASLIALTVPDVGRYGQIAVRSGRVLRFDEKGAATGRGSINGGVYCISRSLIDSWPAGKLSLEQDILPGLASSGALACLEHEGPFVDIGTPESYADAPEVVRRIMSC